VVPEDRESLCGLLEWAWREGVPVIPRGAGTGMPGGNLGPALVVEIGEAFAEVSPLPDGRDRADARDGIKRRSGMRADGGGAGDSYTLKVGAGAIAAEADRIARLDGYHLPFLPSSAPWCTLGGVVANNGAGARSFRHGAVARSVRAIEGIFAWGEPFRVEVGHTDPEPFTALREQLLPTEEEIGRHWPAVRKNSSGYALDRFLSSGSGVQLLCGSEGTLAFITGVEVHALPLPVARGLVVLPARSREELVTLALEAEQHGAVTCEFLGRRFLDIAGLDDDPRVGHLSRDAFALVLLDVEGSDEAVQAAIEAIQSLGDRVGERGVAARSPDEVAHLWKIRHAASPMIARQAERGLVSTQFIEDSVVPPASLGDYLEGLDRILREHRFDAIVFGHAGDGNVHVNPLVDVGADDWERRVRATLADVAGLVRTLGGTLAGEHGDGRLRAPLLPEVWSSAQVAAFWTVKEWFDPGGILNPGVILPLPGQDPLEGFAPRPRSWPV
jgi:FAD/FMN-containing dehydrogenase